MFIFWSQQRNQPGGLPNLLSICADDCGTHSAGLSNSGRYWCQSASCLHGNLAGVDHRDRLELIFSSFNIRPFFPPTRNRAVQELSEKKQGRMVITPKSYFWTETTDALTQLGTCGDSWQYSDGKLLKKLTGTASELFFEVMARHLFQRCMHAGPYQETILHGCCEYWMLLGHKSLPPLDNRQRPMVVHFLEKTIDKVWRFTICAVAIFNPWRLLCHKVVVVWNRRIPLSTKLENEDATRTATSWVLETPSQLEISVPLGRIQDDS